MSQSDPETPSDDAISGRATTASASLANVPESSVEPPLAPLPIQPTPAIYHFEPPVTPLAPALAPLQPLSLPRERPPKPQPGPTTFAAVYHHAPRELAPLNAPARAAPIVQLPPQPEAPQVRKRPPEPAYARGGHLIGGFKTTRYPGVSIANPKFNPDGRMLQLHGPGSLQPWVQQINHIARSLSCLEELTQRFSTFPPPYTLQLFICETRFATAFRVLEASISGQVWAYMRVLGYSSLPSTGEGLMSPTPADCFEYAKRAAAKILIPGSSGQPVTERKRMANEILTAQASDYPSERTFKKGIAWLRSACDNLIRQGDYDLAQLLYEPLPDWAPKQWAPKLPGYEESGTPAATDSDAITSELNRIVEMDAVSATSSEVALRPVHTGSARTPVATIATKLVPEKQQPSKRKRAKKDMGSQPAKPRNSTAVTGTEA